MGDNETTTSISRRSALLALLLLVPAPSFGTWFAMWYAEDTWYGKVVFFAVKLWILILPLMWMIRDGQKPRLPRLTRRGMLAAVITGSLIFNIIAAGYWFLAQPLGWIDAAEVSALAKERGLSTPLIYLIGAIYWCTLNSILEEYVWRWFVFTRCEAICNRYAAVLLSALFFTLHHIIALDLYFNVQVTVLASLGVFIGGATWSWLYLRYRNIYAAYVSHVFADVIIFVIGYLLIFGPPA